MSGFILRDWIQNEHICENVGVASVEDKISESRLKWFGHIEWRPSDVPVMDVFIKAAEYVEMPIRRSDTEPLQKLFVAFRSELNLDLKNIKTEQAKFWKQHPALVKMELLVQAQLARESASLSSSLFSDFKRMLELAPRLLEELVKSDVINNPQAGMSFLEWMICGNVRRKPHASEARRASRRASTKLRRKPHKKNSRRKHRGVFYWNCAKAGLKIAVLPRTPLGHGWLRPAIGVVELSQSIVQAVPLSARKAGGGNSEGIAAFLQLPHFSETVFKKIARKVKTYNDFSLGY
ncbi:hypothetical protein KFK09_000358 [Dendrobium nobile]|uniref:Uncharacterized protein n=1 Tax=Dendrobium nobile TaxID=94219 RepID=A0A8T3CEI4_DENNO|nr:hypothetical protein KFK09_000358 [Dendrobium nobile]